MSAFLFIPVNMQANAFNLQPLNAEVPDVFMSISMYFTLRAFISTDTVYKIQISLI